MRNQYFRKVIFLFLIIAIMLPVSMAGASPREPVTLQFLAVSDWHAQLDPLSVFGVGDVGGAAYISTYWNMDRQSNPNTLTMTAGDAYGASPPISGFFEEVPAVLAMNLMGFDVDTFGNHNFDRGIDHLQQMVDLAEFQYVSANLKNLEDNLTGVKPYEIFEVGGVKVAVIGITNPEAPTLVFPGNFGTIEVTDPVTAANKARAQARRDGAKVFVAITHLGVTGFDPVTGEAQGPLIDFANNVGGFDLIMGDHTDVLFSGVINNALVVENRSKGLTYSKVHLTVDPHNGRTIDRTVEFVTPHSDLVDPDAAIVEMLAPFREALAEAFDGFVGEATDTFPRGGNIERLGEVAIGNLVSDAIRIRYDAQLGFTNGGGIRTPLPSDYLPADTSLRRPHEGFAPGPPWDLVVGDVFAMLPFGNSVVTREVTGALLYEILEHSVAVIPNASGRYGQISGFRFVFDSSLPPGSRLVSVELDDGTPILPDSTVYTFATNDFVNAGGDGYTMLADGEGVTREVMADVVMEYIIDQGVITPTIEGRIVDLANP
jgi:5'-nucleotidase